MTDVVHTDIAKAFDSVSHSKLISVLNSYGIQCNVLNWIRSFSNPVQKVCVNGSFSDTLPVISGVSQESVLGPLLFVVYIDDIVNLVHMSSSANTSDVFLYADDAKLKKKDPSRMDELEEGIWSSVRQEVISKG